LGVGGRQEKHRSRLDDVPMYVGKFLQEIDFFQAIRDPSRIETVLQVP
jgi:hypothetical protein